VYGSTFDVKATENPINIAYSNVALDLHQDLVYYESPPGEKLRTDALSWRTDVKLSTGLQFLHAIQYPETVTGGESILMDGFAVAERLRDTQPQAFATLAQLPMVFEKVQIPLLRRCSSFFDRCRMARSTTSELYLCTLSARSH
jgi:gamma-butyrobetaine dioxygenase